ncbi:MAG: VIT1/CCC1 transporter family protein [Candidatus Micrarchaeota archaeon]|nr:VIT1/CCC1 transporter family protein [Candidatus Micrarchaeota archaeon]
MSQSKSGDGNRHVHSTFLSDFILGSQDGLVNVLGIILGIAAATTDVRIIFVGALAALGAESISMGAVAYTSTMARRMQYIRETKEVMEQSDSTTEHGKKEIRKILGRWNYSGKEIDRIAASISSNPKASLEFIMSLGHKMEPVEDGAPMRSFAIVLVSTIFGSMVPIIPFIFLSKHILLGAIVSVALSGCVLFMIGYYEAKKTVGSVWRSGMRMLIIGLTAGFAGYLIGHFIGAI